MATYFDHFGGEALTAGAVGVTTAGIVAGTTAAGAAPTVAIVNAHDGGGSFDLTPVTGGGAQAAGVVATVRFNSARPTTPKAVVLNIHNTTATPDLPIVASCSAKTVNGFDVLVAAALVTANVYRVDFAVIDR
jgi:hypothetical protein